MTVKIDLAEFFRRIFTIPAAKRRAASRLLEHHARQMADELAALISSKIADAPRLSDDLILQILKAVDKWIARQPRETQILLTIVRTKVEAILIDYLGKLEDGARQAIIERVRGALYQVFGVREEK
jgi:methionine synthase II (cobalamin-independent)